MTFLPSNFPRRVRIRGGEFGASARAMHREAALENVSRATIERKIMSTKTTLKRVALVAVAAMGFGLLSVAPSLATSQADTLTLSSASNSVVVGTAATTTLTQAFTGLNGDTMTVTASLVSAPTGNSTVPVLTTDLAKDTNATTVVSSLVGTMMDTGTAGSYNSATGIYSVSLPTTAIAGTYVIKFTPANVTAAPIAAANAAAITWTVTVNAAAAEASPTAADSTWGMIAGAAAPTQGTHTSVSGVITAGTQVATIVVVPQKPTTTALTTPIKLTATIAGPGTMGWGNGTGGASTGRAITGTAGQYSLAVYADGTTGTSTITVSEPAGAVLFTATVTFPGAVASYVLTPPVKTVTAIGTTDQVAISGKDANGIASSAGTYYVSSSNTAVATVTTTAQSGATFGVTGAGVGTAVITVANALTTPTITKSYTITVGKSTIATLTLKTDKASYGVGEAVVVTVTALGSDGTAVGDATLNAFATGGVVSNLAVQGTLPTAAIAFVGGVKTFTIYAPAIDGTVTLTGTQGGSVDKVIAGGTADTVTATFTVTSSTSGSSQAAIDAANAATDAANYAADAADAATTAAQEATAAAQAAQDSADAATAAVVALGLRVDSLLASVRAQLTSLSNLLVRIIKKGHF
jgi:hypothetical protein